MYKRQPVAVNEPVLSYAPGSSEREELTNKVKELKNANLDIPMYIGGEEIRTGDKRPVAPPYAHKNTIAHYHYGTKEHVQKAIDSALAAREEWANLNWQSRAAIFLRAAELVSGPYRQYLNGATMLAQSKNAFQAEIDAACEYADFLRFNVQYMTEIYSDQPESAPGIWNRLEYLSLIHI